MLTFFFQQGRGYSALLTGLAFLPLTLPMICGFFVTAIGTAMLTFVSVAFYWLLFVGLFLIGYGLSLTIPPLVTAVVTAAPPGQAGVASGALNSIRQLGAALGVSVLSLCMNGAGAHAETAAATAGVNTALLVSAFVLAGGGVITLLFIGRQPRKKQA
ncbi:hypothetical protein O9H85_30655 [Paenibacillus filicis]|uniref:Major facilitator superfamily (MFS) profile domain-containing protein n=1 Tax=Paenibacillus gyeongsangnamensis TaxID=3388067 RepID=A0ABT4QIF5_9BACL|nr:hypothetical protein [Paenibacillus filicis]MCZ8516668.1 hypothetical protein [Paenibacillus filicis]